MATNKTLKVVVRADLSQGSINELLQDIDTLQTKVNKKLEVTVHIKDIVIDESALNSVKGKIQKIFNTVTVDINGNILGVGTGKADGITSIEKYAKTIETRLQNIFNPRLFSDGSKIKKDFDDLTNAIKNAKTKSELDNLSDRVSAFKNSIEDVYKPLSSLQERLNSFGSRKLLNLDNKQISELNALKKSLSDAWTDDTLDGAKVNQLEARVTSLISSMQKGNATAANFSSRMEQVFASFNRINNISGSHKGLNWGDEIKQISDSLGKLYAQINPVGMFNEKNWDYLFNGFQKFGTINVNELRGFFSNLNPDKFSPEQWDLISGTVTELITNLSLAENRLGNVSSKMRRDNGMEVYQKRLSMLSNELDTFYNKYGKIAQNQSAANEYNNLIKRIHDLGENPNDTELTALTKDVKNFQKAAKEAGFTTDTFGEKIQKAYQKFGGWAIITATMTKGIQYIKMMYQNVLLLDSAMTELKKVTDETQAGYDAFMDRAKGTAKEIGAALSDVITATADFSRLGYSMSEAEGLAKAALTYKQVGDGIDNVTTASQTLISTMKAFGDQYGEAGDAMLIVDKLNEVSNTQAITSAGLGETLARSASAMAAAGNTLDETIALATAMNTTLQNPDQVGTTLKTMSMYLRATKVDAEAAGIATDGMASSVSKLRQKILDLTKNTENPVDIMLNPTTFKSSYQIIQELSEVWNQIEDIDKSAIMELIGGKRNANAMASLIQNFDIAQKTLTTSLNAAGSATKENEKYLESIRGKLTQLKSSFESLSDSVMNSDVIKFGIDRITDFVDALDWMTRTFTPIPGLITAAGVALNSLNIKAFDLSFTGDSDKIQNSGLFHLLDNKLFGKQADEAKAAIDNVTEITYDLNDAMEATNIKVANTGNSLGEMTAAMSTAGAGATALRLKQLALNAAFNLGVAAASALLIFIGKQLYDAMVVTAAEMQECADAAKEMSQSIQEGNDYIAQIKEMSAVLSDSTSTQIELNGAKESLLKIQDKLVEKYGAEAKALDLVNGKQEDAIAMIKEMQKNEFNAWRNENSKEIAKASKNYFGYSVKDSNWDAYSYELRKYYDIVYDELQSVTSSAIGKSVGGNLFSFDEGLFSKTIKLSARDADEAYNAISKLMTLITESDDVEKYANAYSWLKIELEKAKEAAEEYSDVATYNASGLAQYDSRFSSYYDDLIEKITTLQDALKTDNSQSISDAYVAAMRSMDLATNAALGSTSEYKTQIADYFRSLYPDLEKEFEQYQFDIRLKTDDSDLQKQFTEITKQLNDMGLNDPIEIKAAINSKELSEPFQQLESVAQEYGFTIDELIDKLEQFGYVQSTNLSGDLFGDSAVEIQKIASGYENSISILERLRKEQDAFGKVSAKSYAELIELGDDYKNIVTSQVDATGELIYVYDSDAAEKFAQQQLNLAIQSLYAADATESEMEAFREMYQSVSTLGSQMQKYVLSAKAIMSLQKEIAKDTEYTYEEVLKLSETYPELSYTYDELSGKYKIEQSSVAGLTKRYDELIKKIIELRQELAQGFSFDAIRAAGYQNADDAQVRGLYKMVEQQIKEHNITSVEEYRKLTNSELKPWVVATIEAILSAQTDTLNYLSDNIQWGEETKSKSSTDAWKEQFDKWYSEKNHALDMGRISEESYVEELEVMYKKYFSNLSKYQDEYFKYEKEVYQKRQALVNEYISKVEDQVKKSGDETQMVTALEKLLGIDQSVLDAYENLLDEQEKIREWGLTEFGNALDFSGNSFVQTVFGNVDMDKRVIINWNEELKKAYKDALDSWDYDPEVGSIDTVFGGSGRFGEDTLQYGVEVAFTPIMNVGGKSIFLDRDTVYSYIESLIGESTVSGVFSSEKLLSLDKMGKQIGNTFIQGLIAAADEGLDYENNANWAETVGRLMHFSGQYGAIALAYKEIENAAREAGLSTEDLAAKLQEAGGDAVKLSSLLNDKLSKEQKATISSKIIEYTVKGYQDSIDLLEDQIDLIDDKNDSEEEVISIYKQILGYLDTIREYYKSLGYDESSDQLLELSRKYQDYVDKIDDINKKLYEKQKEAQIKLLEEENDAIDDAIDAMDDILDATVDLIKRELNAQIDALEDQKDAIKEHYDDLKDSTNEYYSDLKDKAKDAYDSQKEEMNTYYDNLIDKIKESSDAQKKALKDELDAYKKIIDAQKEKLQGIRDEENYNSDVAEKNKNISSLQSQIDALSLDDSREAQAKRLKLEEELAKAKKDLADYQADYTLNKQLDALDKEYDAFEENINKQIDAIEDAADEETKIYQKKQKEMLKLLESQHNAELDSIEERKQAALDRIEAERESALAALDSQIDALQEHLSKEGVLWQEANDRIRTQGASLWKELRAYAAEYTRDVEKLEGAWNKALLAVDKYNGGSMDFSQTKNNATNKKNQNESEKNRLENETYVGGGGKNRDENQLIDTAKAQMQENSRMWHKAASQYEKDMYAQMNQEIASSLNRTLGRNALTYNAAKGVWYLDGVRFYHKGGIVGSGTLKQNETLAVLQKGEAVLTKQSQESLAKYMDIAKTITSAMVSWRADDPVKVISKGLIRRGSVYGHDVEPIVVEKLFDFHADNVTSETMPQLEKLLKKASDYTVEQLEDRLSRRGVKTKIKGNSI